MSKLLLVCVSFPSPIAHPILVNTHINNMIPTTLISSIWKTKKITTALEHYVRVPNLSPAFGGHTSETQDRALAVLTQWIETECKDIKKLQYQVRRLPERTPLLFVEIGASHPETESAPPVLMYGHFDKQPPFSGWDEGLQPYEPVIRNGKLYGRGSADDGYACFGALTAIAAMQQSHKPHGRVVVLIEGSEESGSPDLPSHIDKLVEEDKIGPVELVVCLDSGAGSYDRLWVTSSLRGIVMADLTVSVLKEGVHSGDASGVVPSTFRVARHLLSRLEDAETGRILPPEMHAADLESRRGHAVQAAQTLGDAGMVGCFPFLPGVTPPTADVGELGLNRWWRPQLEIIGADGLPASPAAGNVLRPSTTLTLSLRLPPTVQTKAAEDCLRRVLLGQPALHNAHVELTVRKSSQGWAAPPPQPWLAKAAQAASAEAFGQPAVYQGEGGSIPFMAMLGRMFPKADFFVTGVLGPGANAHGPNEFLHLDFCARIVACVANVLTAYALEHIEGTSKRAKPESGAGLAEEYTRDKQGRKI